MCALQLHEWRVAVLARGSLCHPDDLLLSAGGERAVRPPREAHASTRTLFLPRGMFLQPSARARSGEPWGGGLLVGPRIGLHGLLFVGATERCSTVDQGLQASLAS